MNNAFWLDCHGPVDEETIKSVQAQIGVTFPKSFIELVKNCDGGAPIKSALTYYNTYHKKTVYIEIGNFLSFDTSEEVYETIIDFYKIPSEFYNKNLIAFADTGSGDLFYFDYRQGKDNKNPPVVYWNHEAEEGKDVFFLANNFEEFLEMLYEPQDDEI